MTRPPALLALPVLAVLCLFPVSCKLGTLGGDLGAVDAPSDLAVSAISSTQLVVSWTDESDAEDGFTIERAEDDGGVPSSAWTVAGNVGADVESFSDSALTEATLYWYRVFAYSSAHGDSSKAGPVSGRTRLSEPAGAHATVLSGPAVDLAWTDVSSHEDGYRIERADDLGGSPSGWTVIAETAVNEESYRDETVHSSSTYWYRLSAFSSTYSDSNYTEYLEVEIP